KRTEDRSRLDATEETTPWHRVSPIAHLRLVEGSASRREEGALLLANILRLYHAAMMGDVRSPVPHLVGPPGCGKSTSVEQAAQLLGVNLHVINVSRISPLELEGVQMPVDENS